MKTEEHDLLIISAGENPTKALTAVIDRANQCVSGVPEETRIADGFGSKYTRPLPGAERMYPESDIPPITVNKELFGAINIPKTLSERAEELEKELPKHLAEQLARSHYYGLYQEVKKSDPVLVATTFLNTFVDLKRSGIDVDRISHEDVKEIFSLVAESRIGKKSVRDILEQIGRGASLKQIVKQFYLISVEDLRKEIRAVLKEKPDLSESAYMGLIMQKVKGRAEGSRILELLRKEMA